MDEVIHKPGGAEKLLKKLSSFFNPANETNPLRACLKWDAFRLSIAGGESLLYPQKILDIARKAKKLRFQTFPHHQWQLT